MTNSNTSLLSAILRTLLLSVFVLCSATARTTAQDSVFSMRDSLTIVRHYTPIAERIIAAAERDSSAWERLALFCDTFGPRLSGTAALERAIDWVAERLRREGYDTVRLQDVMVPHWERGIERCDLVEPIKRRMPMLGLGGSVGTPPEGISAKVLVVGSFEELERRAEEARGKIVLFNAAFSTYGATVRYRYSGAVKAAKAGAVASLVRSVGPFSMQTPHTGSMGYEDATPRIPHAAITMEDALLLQRLQDRGQTPTIRLQMGARTLPDAPSRNIIAQITGRERPEEIIVFGGHIDSWDVGRGAMDDGGGCVAAWQALKILTELELRPRRTIRLVMWTNEENGLRGAKAYAEEHRHEKHILGLESDSGVFAPTGFGFTGSPSRLKIVRAIAALLRPIGADSVSIGGGGADVSPLNAQGVDVMGLQVDMSRYFWYHHTDADTPDKLDPREVNHCAAAMAVMVYVFADLP